MLPGPASLCEAEEVSMPPSRRLTLYGLRDRRERASSARVKEAMAGGVRVWLLRVV